MKVLGAALASAAVLAGSAMISAFGYRWQVVDRGDWGVERQGGVEVLSLEHGRDPLPGPRRPIQFALADTAAFRRVKVDGDMRPKGRSLMVVVAYQDPAHFDYVHLSIDTGVKQPVHNGVFHVFGGERVRISSPEGPPAFAESNRWYHVTVEYDGSSGSVRASVDGRDVPALHAVDLSLSHGKIGLGSFDETGDFKNVKISGEAYRAQ